jgi:hypothetical protein
VVIAGAEAGSVRHPDTNGNVAVDASIATASRRVINVSDNGSSDWHPIAQGRRDGDLPKNGGDGA